MYTINEIKELIEAVDKSTLTSLTVSGKDDKKISIKREVTINSSTPAVLASAPVAEIAHTAQPTVQTEELVQGTAIKSPIVGVFYSAPSPDSEPYVTVGQTVKKGDTLCIIEAMKLMNEISAEKSGIISEICAKNGDIIEYGQTLFILK